MKTRVVRNKVGNYWTVLFDGDTIGTWRTPREARHKARMWWMWLTTGDKTYLRKTQ